MPVVATTIAHAYPMIRAGGLFILLMGCGVALGSVIPTWRRLLLAAGAVIASLALIAWAPRLSAPLGRPTPFQIEALVGAIIFEIVAIRVVVAAYRNDGERSLLLGILFAVGLNFLPMGFAFGPVCAALGVASSTSAATGLWVARWLPLNGLWAADGFMKIVFGAAMLGVGW